MPAYITESSMNFTQYQDQTIFTCFGKTPSNAVMTTMSIRLPAAFVMYLRARVTAFMLGGACSIRFCSREDYSSFVSEYFT